jgi:hypothetical protein
MKWPFAGFDGFAIVTFPVRVRSNVSALRRSGVTVAAYVSEVIFATVPPNCSAGAGARSPSEGDLSNPAVEGSKTFAVTVAPEASTNERVVLGMLMRV